MKKVIFCGLLAAGCCFSAAAQSKLSPAAQFMLAEKAQAEKLRHVANVPENVFAYVTLNDGEDASLLKEAGLEVIYTTGNINIVTMPLARAEAIAEMPQVKLVEFGERSDIRMDVARRLSFVDEVNAGYDFRSNGQSMSFTGNGVITGLYDTGLDPNHAAFRNADGSSRVKAVVLSTLESNGTSKVTVYDTPEAIANFSTDKQDESHGTHVAGIMAGSRGVNGKYAQANGQQTIRTEGDIPYYGVAYNSNLVIGCGDFYDAAIMAGVTRVVTEAKQLGMPAVINLSLGNNSGSHDPNSSNAQVLDALAKDAVICVAAGNEGENPMAIQKQFSRMGGLTLNTFMTAASNSSLPISYTAEFWSGSSAEFEFELVIYDKLDQKVISSQKITPRKEPYNFNPSNWSAFGDLYTSSSYANVSCNVDPQTNRFFVITSCSTQYSSGSSTKLLGVNITGQSGEKCFAYINAGWNAQQEVVFSSQNVQGYIDGTPDGSINGFGCGKLILSVGSYCSRTSAPFVGNGNYSAGGTVGAISPFSSYGEIDGQQMPLICAPGQQIVSSISQYWYNNQKFTEDKVCAISNQFNHTSAYYPMQGTSMATPFAAGVVALMLEANPDLTSQEVINILKDKQYATTDAQTNGVDFKRWGAGKINAIKAVKGALGVNSLGQSLADNMERNFMIEQTGAKQYNLIVPGASEMKVTFFNLQGMAALTTGAASDVTAVDASALESGLYIVSVDTDFGTLTRKMVIK